MDKQAGHKISCADRLQDIWVIELGKAADFQTVQIWFWLVPKAIAGIKSLSLGVLSLRSSLPCSYCTPPQEAQLERRTAVQMGPPSLLREDSLEWPFWKPEILVFQGLEGLAVTSQSVAGPDKRNCLALAHQSLAGTSRARQGLLSGHSGCMWHCWLCREREDLRTWVDGEAKRARWGEAQGKKQQWIKSSCTRLLFIGFLGWHQA